MITSAKTLLRIDRWFRSIHLLSNRLLRGNPSTPGSGRVLVIKLMGLGSIIEFAARCDQHGVDKDNVIILSFETHREVTTLFGFGNSMFIRTNSLINLLRDCWRAINHVKGLGITTVVDLERCSHAVGTFSTILTWNSGARKIGFHHGRIQTPRVTIFDVDNLSFDSILLTSINYLPRRPQRVVVRETFPRMNRILVNANASEYLLARRYPRQEFSSLIEEIDRRIPGMEFRFTGSTGERSYVDPLVAALRKRNIQAVNLVGQLSLADLTNELANCAVFITGDSGPLHLAAYLQIPMVAIWGPTQPVHFGYDKQGNIRHATRKLPCSPCFRDPESKPAIACQGQIHCMKFSTMDLASQVVESINQSKSPRSVRFPSGIPVNHNETVA